jgi:hypothetical protein
MGSRVSVLLEKQDLADFPLQPGCAINFEP